MTTIDDLFPEKGKLVLAGSGREFIERLGTEAARQVILGVLRGENIRHQTEPLTRRRVAIATGAMVALFIRGWREIDDFTDKLSQMALAQMDSTSQTNKVLTWPANWLIGMTGKGIQNVIRGDANARGKYIMDFEAAVEEAATRCEADFGSVNMTLGFVEDRGKVVKTLGWKDITRLTTAIGSATLTIRGSEKSTYGKLFERLVLGAVLTILGFDYVDNANSPKIENVFWLSDNTDERECDATVRLRAGKLARFDMGFIGKGNPEIIKDKLSRYAEEVRLYGIDNTSRTFVVIDRMPETFKTSGLAARSKSEIIQMSMQYWPQELARRIEARIGYEAEILNIPEDGLNDYLTAKVAPIPILNFLKKVEVGLSEETDNSVELQTSFLDDKEKPKRKARAKLPRKKKAS